METEHQKAIDMLNQIAADMGLFGKVRTQLIYWRVPKKWKGTKYAFGYTPWKTKDDTGKEGFFALKYRILRNGTLKLVKSVRFGRRKVARERSWQWYRKYYKVNGGPLT